MLKSILDGVMEKRARQLLSRLRAWLPGEGPVLDLGSGTGHLSARLERELGIEVVTADVTDLHVVGPPPILIGDGVLPFEDSTFSAALLVFVLSYPKDAAAVLAEVARVTRGRVIVVQSLYSGRVGYAWFRGREFFWTIMGFYVSRIVGYVPRKAKFTMQARRFYTREEFSREVATARLRVHSQHEQPVLPGRALVVAAWVLERND